MQNRSFPDYSPASAVQCSMAPSDVAESRLRTLLSLHWPDPVRPSSTQSLQGLLPNGELDARTTGAVKEPHNKAG